MISPRKFRLGATLIFPFIVQIVTAVGLVGYLSFRNGQQAVNDLAAQLRDELSEHIKQQLGNYVDIPHKIIRLSANAYLNGEVDIETAQKGEHIFQEYLQVSPFVSALYCGSEQSGSFLAIDKSKKYGFTVLTFNNAATEGYREYYKLDTNTGKRSDFLERGTKKYDPRVRPWYKAAKAKGSPGWSPIYLDFDTQLPTITSTLPIYQSAGNLVGVCAADLYLPAEFSKFLQGLKIGKSGVAFAIERSGVLVSTSTQEPMSVGTGEETKRLSALESSNPIIQATARHLRDRFGSFDQLRTTSLDFSWDGDRQFVQILNFQDGRGLDWLVVLVVPEADFMDKINTNTRIIIILCVLALVVAIAIGILTGRLITTPILRLTKASKQLADGNLDQRVDTKHWIDLEEIDTLEQSFNRMAEQLQESFETLEDKVKERTAELAQANAEISDLNEKLKEENLRMGAELNVARQIQQMILPKPEELSNIEEFDIAGYMEPADEVGGDYYDVLYVDGVVTIGIGDVTGHGLESGLLMLMTQTAVRTLKEIQELDPVRFLDTLNRTIYKNVQRMNSNRNLTLAILNYSQGKVSISGQHEEILVVRQGGKIERIDTIDLGLPIGLDDEIADFIHHLMIDLQPGDGLVVYTDGITEAMNLDRQQYGIERLCEAVSQNWHLLAEDIKEQVIEDVRQFIGQQKIFDDITLLILKRQEDLSNRLPQAEMSVTKA